MNGTAIVEKFRIPLGSFIVDMTMVLSAVWWAGGQNVKTEELERRMTVSEITTNSAGLATEVAALKARADRGSEDRKEIREALTRIEDKVDRMARGR